jgi:hypothetical protein
MARFFRLCFGKSNAGHLWRAIGATGNALWLHRMRCSTGDHFSNHNPFMTGLMRKPWGTRHIANGINTRHRVRQ